MDYEYLKLKEKLETPDGKRIFERFEKEYIENYQGKDIPLLDYKLHKLIYQTGDRAKYEEIFFQSRKRLALLQVLALGDDKYLDDLEEILAAICDKYTWILPAHSHLKNGKFDYTFIDLYSAETAFYLSETAFVFKDKLSIDIRDRIEYSLKTKIVENFEKRTFWYERKDGTNWTSACAGSIGIMYLYSFPERFVLVKDRLIKMCEYYMNGLHDDGVCEEGLVYWWYGFGFLAYFIDVYKQKYGELPEFMCSEKVQKTLQYRMKGLIDGRAFPFADANTDLITGFPVAELTIKKLFPKFALPDYDFIGRAQVGSKSLALRLIDSIGRFDREDKSEDSKESEEFSMHYDDSQIFVCKKNAYTFLTKGGHNQEMHNHNDVGVFALYVGGKRIIADLGAGEYTWEYFNDPKARYEEKIFACGSLSHSLPIVDGEYQKFGRDKKAEVVFADENGIAFNIASAYGLSDENLTVAYNCKDDGVSISYAFKGKNRQITYRFISDYEPRIENGEVWLDDVKIVCDTKCSISTSSKVWKPNRKPERTNYILDFAVDPYEEGQVKFEFIIRK